MSKKIWVFASVFGACLAVDQLTKLWVVNTLATRCTRTSPPGCVDEIPIIPGFFSFVHAQNHGAAFSALDGQWAIFMVFTVIATIVVLDLVRRLRPDAVMIAGVLGMILAGALGNGIDRMRSRPPGSPGLGTPLPLPGSEPAGEHYVTDFLRVYTESPGLQQWFVDNFGTNTWPIFNIADSVLLVGVALFLVHYLFLEEGDPDDEFDELDELDGAEELR